MIGIVRLSRCIQAVLPELYRASLLTHSLLRACPSKHILIVNHRERFVRITWLFVSLMADFWLSVRLARLRGRTYDLRADSRRNRRRAIRFREVALEMGGVLIKLGQFLSTRVDVLPPEYIEELGSLQDQVPQGALCRHRADDPP